MQRKKRREWEIYVADRSIAFGLEQRKEKEESRSVGSLPSARSVFVYVYAMISAAVPTRALLMVRQGALSIPVMLCVYSCVRMRVSVGGVVSVEHSELDDVNPDEYTYIYMYVCMHFYT